MQPNSNQSDPYAGLGALPVAGQLPGNAITPGMVIPDAAAGTAGVNVAPIAAQPITIAQQPPVQPMAAPVVPPVMPLAPPLTPSAPVAVAPVVNNTANVAAAQVAAVTSQASGAAAPKGTTPQKAKSNPNSTQNVLEIAEIRDGIVIMNDGTYRSVIMVKSVNFDLMSPQEQEAVEYSYQGFLNSLYFPIQIFIRSQKVDLRPYIDKLDKIRTEHDNMLLAMLMEDYVDYIDALSQQTNIMDKKFYVVVPYFPNANPDKDVSGHDQNFFSGLAQLFNKTETHVVINEAELQKAKDELRNRVQAVLGGLMQAGIQGLPLDTQELIELYYDTYNPDTATRQQLKNFNDLTVDVVTKGQGTAPQAHLQREMQ